DPETKKGAHHFDARLFRLTAVARLRGGWAPALPRSRGASVGEEDRLDLVLDLFLGLIARNRDFLHDQPARRVEHPALAEGQLLVRLEAIEVAQHLRHVVNRAGLDLVHEPAVPAVPGLRIEADRALTQDVENLPDLLLADDLPQPDRVRIGHRNHDLPIGVEDPQDVETLPLPGAVLLVDADHLGDPLSGIDRLVTDLELDFRARLHECLLDYAVVFGHALGQARVVPADVQTESLSPAVASRRRRH